MPRFTDKVAIITGASTGLGPIMARMMAAEGARVVMAARRIALVEKEAADIGEAAVAVRADVTQEADVAAMVDVAMRRWGQVDIMINNAAIPGTDKYIWEQTLENWNATIAVDVTAAMLCSREVVQRTMMARKSGSIVNLSSGAGRAPYMRKGHYCTAKAGLISFTAVLAQELADHGIRANCVVPGPIDTELLRNYYKRIAREQGITAEEVMKNAMVKVAQKRPCAPEEIANAVLFLASDDASCITGQSVNADGGTHFN